MDQNSVFSKLPALMLMLLIYCNGVKMIPTYEHVDHVTGQILRCHRCPPGYFMLSHCTATHQTKCGRCPPNHFTQYWNYLSKCLYCNKFCTDKQIVKEECSANHNRVCECKQGYYWHSEFCIKHAECPRGYGVTQKGTVHRNTECEKCAHGFYSSSTSSQDNCLKHTNCTALGLQMILKGTARRDNFCASNEDLKTRGGLQLLKKILPEFLASIKRAKKIKKIVQRTMQATKKHSHEQLQNYITRLVQDAGEVRLRRLPGMLRKFNFHSMARKLQKLISKFL